MQKTMPITVQLSGGINNKTSDTNAIKPGISYTENTDFTVAAEISGRPSFVSRNIFAARQLTTVPQPSATAPVVNDSGTFEMDNVPFEFTSLFRCRDSLGERPGLCSNGRMWTWENTRWTDRLYTGTARFERLVDFNLSPGVQSSAPGTWGMAIGYNFAPGDADSFGAGTPMLSDTATTGVGGPNIMGYLAGSNFLLGTACSAVDNNGDVYNCCVGNPDIAANNNLVLSVRKNNDMVITNTTLKTDCGSVHNLLVPATGAQTRPQCCTDEFATATFGVPTIFVVYARNVVSSWGVLRVNVATGVIISSTVYTFANGSGMSIASISSRNVLGVAFIDNTTGVKLRKFNATTCVNDATADISLNTTIGTPSTGVQVTIGIYNPNTPSFIVAWCETHGGANTRTSIVGVYSFSGGPASAYTLKTYNPDDPSSGWLVAHTPVYLHGPAKAVNNFIGSGRAVVGLYYVHIFNQPGITSFYTLTYVALDFTDVNGESTNTTSLFGSINPGILAIGPIDTAAGFLQANATPVPSSGIVSPNKSAFRFGSQEYRSFAAIGPSDVAAGINQVTLTYPKATYIGEETVLSGSVPRSICREYSAERIFVQNSPEIVASAVAVGSTLLPGSYSLQAVWRRHDAAGVIHRSAPSLTQTVVITGPAQSVRVIASNLVVHNWEASKIFVELYMTPVNPTTSSQKFIVGMLPQTANSAITQFTISGLPNQNNYTLYTNNGAILQNTPVSADGGVATVNRRIFVSDGKFVYASKLYDGTNNTGVSWNDEGPLVIRVPTPAGRIVSLEAFDDKLLIFCEHGIFFTQGDGPDDTGLGSQFLAPVQISELGAQNERATISTTHGVAFYNPNSTTAGLQGYGGVYLVDRGLTVKKISDNIQNLLISQGGSTFGPGHLAYSPEKDTLFLTRQDNGTGAAGEPVGGFIFVLDMSAGDAPGQWSLWTSPNGGGVFADVVGSNGVLWATCSNIGGTAVAQAVGSFDGVPGTDQAVKVGLTATDYHMLVRTNHIFTNGNDGLGWSRVRSVTPQGNTPLANTYTQATGVTLDQTATYSNSVAVVNTTPAGISWPTPRDAAEFRLPQQKCSQIQLELSASPAVARWTTARLDVLPSKNKAPAAQRR